MGNAKDKTGTGPGSAGPPKPGQTVFTMPLSDLRQAAATVRELLAQTDKAVPGLVGMTTEQRKHSSGKFKQGEEKATTAIINATAAFPHYFQSLKAEDFGVDPEHFEPEAILERAERFQLLIDMRDGLVPFAGKLDDTILRMAEQFKSPATKAYQIIKGLKSDEALQTAALVATEYYAAQGRKSKATKEKNKKAAAAAAK